jgi:hypothetical protein
MTEITIPMLFPFKRMGKGVFRYEQIRQISTHRYLTPPEVRKSVFGDTFRAPLYNIRKKKPPA